MTVQKTTHAVLVAAVAIGMLAAPLAAQSRETPGGHSLDRFKSHFTQWNPDRGQVVPLLLKDGGEEWGHMCGTPPPTSEFLSESQMAMSVVSSETRGLGTEAFSVQIPLVFHVLQTASGKGYITDEQIDEQVRILNHKFRKLGTVFYVQGVNDVVKKGWFKKCLPVKKNGNLNRKYFKFTRRLGFDRE